MWQNITEEMANDNVDVAEEVDENQLPATLADCFKHSYDSYVTLRNRIFFNCRVSKRKRT